MLRGILKVILLAGVMSSATRAAEPARPQTESLPKGEVIERVACQADAKQTYALYLPRNYTPDRKWPLLYCYDPVARGRIPVERFKEAAEKYGYIVAGSNNSQNGLWEPTQAAIRALWDDTHARFSLDERRIYATGFSGGARVAVRVGVALNGGVAGVIGHGAGFPSDITPAASTPFAYFGAVGVEDYNFPEMKALDEKLDALGVTNHFEVFEGGHEWAPAQLCTEAIEWMELQAMKAARRPRDEAFVEALFNRALERARALEAAQKSYDAFALYDALAKDFKGLRDVAALEKKALEMKGSKEVRQSLKRENEQIKKQRLRAEEIMTLASGLLDPASRETAIADLRRAIADLRSRARAEEDSDERRVSRRALRQVLAELNEASQFRHRDNPQMAVVNLEVAAEVSPDNPQVFYRLACAHSLTGQKKKAIEALKKAVEKGFADVQEIETNKALEPLRQEAAYRAIVEELKGRRSS